MRTREQDMDEWLRENGVEGTRRFVRESAATILVSKFEEDFASVLITRLALLPALFDRSVHATRYIAVATAQPELSRAGAWRLAAYEILHEQANTAHLTPVEIAEVAAGVDSVAALLDSVLFMGASASSPEEATPAEWEAYRDALKRMDADRGIFARTYGAFDGKAVVNHCPGARFARELFELAWSSCAVPKAPALQDSTRTSQRPTAGA